MLGQVPECEPPARLPKIEMLLAKPQANRKEIAAEARQAARDLHASLSKVASARYDRETVRRQLAALADKALKQPPANWDQADQLCLALLALAQAQREHLRQAKEEPSGQDERIAAALQELTRKLAFPKGTESPANFRRSPSFDGELAELLKQIVERPRP
jgi:hypothetical protein